MHIKKTVLYLHPLSRGTLEGKRRVKKDFTKFIDILTDSVASDFSFSDFRVVEMIEESGAICTKINNIRQGIKKEPGPSWDSLTV